MFQCFYKLLVYELPNLFYFLFSCLSFIIDFKKLFLLRKKTHAAHDMNCSSFPRHFVFVSWLYSWFFALSLLRAEVSFLFSHVVFCDLDSELLIKGDFPCFTFTNEFSYFFLLFLWLSFLNVKKKKKKKNPPFGIVPDVWCEIWIQFFFFPQMGYSTTPFIEKSIFAFTFVLIFLCVDFYIVLKFISKDIVLLILAVLNVFPIRRFNCLLLVHNKFIAFCLLLSMSHYFPEFSHSL